MGLEKAKRVSGSLENTAIILGTQSAMHLNIWHTLERREFSLVFFLSALCLVSFLYYGYLILVKKYSKKLHDEFCEVICVFLHTLVYLFILTIHFYSLERKKNQIFLNVFEFLGSDTIKIM